MNSVSSSQLLKALSRICEAEKVNVSSDVLSSITQVASFEIFSYVLKNCDGDIRHAINSLQFFAIGESHQSSSQKSNQKSSQKSSQGKKTRIPVPKKKTKVKVNDEDFNS